jgi:hypothetical protein
VCGLGVVIAHAGVCRNGDAPRRVHFEVIDLSIGRPGEERYLGGVAGTEVTLPHPKASYKRKMARNIEKRGRVACVANRAQRDKRIITNC